MGLFSRKPKADVRAQKASEEREALRRRWEQHMERMPPGTSMSPELVELRARLAEFDARASRFVGAVLMDRASGVEPPLDGVGDLAAEMATLSFALPADKEELRFHLREFTEASAVVVEAMALQRP